MRDIVLALFVFGTIPFIFVRPYVGLLMWTWFDYMNPHRLTSGFAYSFPWVMLIAVVTIISIAMSSEDKRVRMTPTVVLLALFLAWITFTTFFAAVPDSAWKLWNQTSKTLIMVAVTLMLVKDRRRMDWLIWVIVISLGFYGVKGGLFTLIHGGTNRVFGPAASFIGDNNDLALALCMTIPLARYLQMHAARRLERFAFGVIMGFTGIAVLGTYSRGGLIALAAIAAMLLLKSRAKISVAVVLVVIGMIAYHFMPSAWMARMDTLHHAEQVNTLQTRIQSWEFAANVALHRPLVGGGFNVYESPSMWLRYAPEGAQERAVHSIYFRVLGEQGFPGLILFVSLLVVSWRQCTKVRRATRHSPDRKWAFDLASMFQVSLLAYMVGGSATTGTYFDFSFQLFALCTLLRIMATAGSRVPRAADGGATQRTVAEGRAAAVAVSTRGGRHVEA